MDHASWADSTVATSVFRDLRVGRLACAFATRSSPNPEIPKPPDARAKAFRFGISGMGSRPRGESVTPRSIPQQAVSKLPNVQVYC